MGADTMRWLYCSQNPAQELRFGYGLAEEVKRRFLTFWNSVKFFVDYANTVGFRPSWPAEPPEGVLAPLDRWLVERTHAFVHAGAAAYDAYDTVGLTREWESFVDDLSNWYIRRSRRRFWDGDDEAAFATLWYALVQPLRVLAPILPFVTDHLWRTLVVDGPESVHLAGWPEVAEPDRALLDEIAEVRRVVELGRQARSTSGIKLRQPLRRLVVEGASLDGHVEEIADELRVKEVELGAVEAVQLRVKPNLPKLGPKLGKELGTVREALAAGEFEELPDGRFRVGEHELAPDEVLVERGGREGWAVASGDGVTVALDLGLDDELVLEGEAYELIHRVNSLRKERGLELTDRIALTVPDAQRKLVDRHGDWIAREVLATELRVAGDELKLEKS
jgi:isoleucyl-tRNA synthetase